MRKIYSYLLVLLSISAIAQDIVIPDANFKAALLTYSPTIDTNSDGEIQLSEAGLVTQLNVSHKNIASLMGIENFTNLTYLNCSFNSLTSFIGTSLVHLQELQCQNNIISSLTVDTLPALVLMNFDNNHVATVDLYNNVVLNMLTCNNNLLTQISLCGTVVLWFSCANNPNLVYISVKNNINSIVLGGRNAAAEPPAGQFDFTGCPLLETVCYDEGELQAVEWTLPFAGINLVTDCSLDCELATEAFEVLEEYAIAPNPVGDILNITNGIDSIRSIYIYNAVGQLVSSVFKSPASIDVTALKTGTYFVEIHTDKGQTTKKFVKL
jgi:hypothetical protein